MDKQFTRVWHIVRNQQYQEWACWIGQPIWYDGGLFVNRSNDEHIASKILRK